MSQDIRDYRPGTDDAAVLALRRNVWGSDHHHNDAAFLAWLYRENPAGRGGGVVMRRDDRVIGFSGLSARRVLCGGDDIRTAQFVDLMIDSSIRSGLSGLYAYRIILEWAKHARAAGFQLGIGFPREAAYRIGVSPKVGWKIGLEPNLLLRPLARARFQRSPFALVPPLCLTAGARLGALYCRALARGVRRVPGEPRVVDRFDDTIDDLWSRTAGDLQVATWRDAAYLNWRYCDHPIYSYTRLAWHDGRRASGFLVASRREVSGIPMFLVVDFLADRFPGPVSDALLREAVSLAEANDSQMLAALAIAGTPFYRSLRRAGFQPVPRAIMPKFITGLLHDLGGDGAAADLSPVWHSRAWHFTWGDMDVV